MVITQFGDHTETAQKLVVVGCRRDGEHVPIHHLPMVDRTAVYWDATARPGNATISRVQVKWTNSKRSVP